MRSPSQCEIQIHNWGGIAIIFTKTNHTANKARHSLMSGLLESRALALTYCSGYSTFLEKRLIAFIHCEPKKDHKGIPKSYNNENNKTVYSRSLFSTLRHLAPDFREGLSCVLVSSALQKRNIFIPSMAASFSNPALPDSPRPPPPQAGVP